MATDTRKFAETRKAERNVTVDLQARQAVALEQIADTLEALRIDLVSWSQAQHKIPADNGLSDRMPAHTENPGSDVGAFS